MLQLEFTIQCRVFIRRWICFVNGKCVENQEVCETRRKRPRSRYVLLNGAVRTKAVHLLETRRNNERHIPDSLSEMSKVKVKSYECTAQVYGPSRFACIRHSSPPTQASICELCVMYSLRYFKSFCTIIYFSWWKNCATKIISQK